MLTTIPSGFALRAAAEGQCQLPSGLTAEAVQKRASGRSLGNVLEADFWTGNDRNFRLRRHPATTRDFSLLRDLRWGL